MRRPTTTRRVVSTLLATAWVASVWLPATAQPGQPQDVARPVFRAAVELLMVEATAVDSAGAVARGLEAADFTVEVNGKAREVVSAEFVAYRDARDPDSSRRDALADLTTNEVVPTRTILLVVDQTSLRFDQRGALEGAKRWLATLAPDDRLGFLGLPAPGPLVEFTTDHATVLAAFAHLKAGVAPMPPPYFMRHVALWEAFEIVERNESVLAAVVARECRRGEPQCTTEILENARAVASDSAQRVQPVLQELLGVFRGLGALPGPKHVVLVSSGWPIETRRAATDVTALAAAAARANVTVHVLTQEDWAMAASFRVVAPQRTLDQNLLLQSVEALAGYTGGRSVRLVGTGEAAFASLNRGLTGYYLLAVHAAPEDLDGAAKRITVQVRRNGVSLAGYRRVIVGARGAATAPAEASTTRLPCDAAIRNTLAGAAPSTALGLRATSYVLHGEESGSTRIALVGDVTRAAIGAATAVAVLFDRDGRPSPGTTHDVQVPPSGAALVVTSLTAPPGQYVLRLVVCDGEGRVGSLDRPVDTRWRETAGTATTGLVLLRGSGQRGEPLQPVLDAIDATDRLVVQLPLARALAGEGRRVTYEVTSDRADGPEVTRWLGRLGTTAAGALVDEVVIPAGALAPGTYTIAAAIDPGATRVSARTFTVRTVPRP